MINAMELRVVQLNKYLLVALALLTGFSLFTFIEKHKRADAEVVGHEFLMAFNPSDVATIEIHSDSGSAKTVLKKDRQFFRLETASNFPASSKKVSEFFYLLSSIKVSDVVTKKSSLEILRENKLTQDHYFRRIILRDKEGKEITDFYIGLAYNKKGHSLRFAQDENIYLSEESLYPFYRSTQFYDLNLTENVTFKKFFQRNEAEVKDLIFNEEKIIKIQDELELTLSYVKKGDFYYYRPFMKTTDLPEKIVLSKKMNQAELLKVDSMVKKKEKAISFNKAYAGFVFSLDAASFEKLL